MVSYTYPEIVDYFGRTVILDWVEDTAHNGVELPSRGEARLLLSASDSSNSKLKHIIKATANANQLVMGDGKPATAEAHQLVMGDGSPASAIANQLVMGNGTGLDPSFLKIRKLNFERSTSTMSNAIEIKNLTPRNGMLLLVYYESQKYMSESGSGKLESELYAVNLDNTSTSASLMRLGGNQISKLNILTKDSTYPLKFEKVITTYTSVLDYFENGNCTFIGNHTVQNPVYQYTITSGKLTVNTIDSSDTQFSHYVHSIYLID